MMGRKKSAAFTIVELLVVIGIIAILSVLSVPALQTLRGSGAVNAAGSNLSASLRLARAYAIANTTYVRVCFTQRPSSPGALPATVIVFLYAAGGDLDSATADDMADAGKWPSLAKTAVLENFLIYDALQGTSPDTSDDALPSQSTIPAFSRRVASGTGAPTELNFHSGIQFNPNGEARVDTATSARYIKIALDQPRSPADTQARGQDPCIVRLSGVNGSIAVLRKGAGI